MSGVGVTPPRQVAARDATSRRAVVQVGIPAAFTNAETQAGKKSYAIPFPATQPGNHTISIRACNPDVCSEGIAPFAFKIAVVPVTGSNGRIVKGGQ
jgi:hypothetical protein